MSGQCEMRYEGMRCERSAGHRGDHYFTVRPPKPLSGIKPVPVFPPQCHSLAPGPPLAGWAHPDEPERLR